VLGHGSHLLDTARYLGGPITALRARLSTKGDRRWRGRALIAPLTL
jgi:hypothetical protein